jgi:hypothetical protein
MARRTWTDVEIALVLHLYRDEGRSYQSIADAIGRNVSSIGWIIRREDARDDAREEAEDRASGALPRTGQPRH